MARHEADPPRQGPGGSRPAIDLPPGASDGRQRVVIARPEPSIEGGRHAAKAIAGDPLVVSADVLCDGHEELAAVARWRVAGGAWNESPLAKGVNDRWSGSITPRELGPHELQFEAWVDRFGGWRRDLAKRAEAGQDLAVEMQVGAALVREAARTDCGDDAGHLADAAALLEAGGPSSLTRALSPDLAERVRRAGERRFAVTLERPLPLQVDRPRARFSTWYELFPRSWGPQPGRHGTLRDVAARLPYVADMGFDVLYLPPIHPIGTTHRKGRNNAPRGVAGDVGSPWAIGSREGGHDAIHPDLGTLEDFRALVQAARSHGMEIALDLALQCSPDHPWVRQHPEWFRHLPDGSIRHAENPPKKYEDIYPLDFETEGWRELWRAVLSVVLHWIGQGVRAFRVDNPHTKPFRFWEWLIAEVRAEHPDVIFLAEAFTRPKVMEHLARIGFSQSYTYFTWRNTAHELREYMTELTRTELRHSFRPNFWPNTPDILHETLQHGGRPAFALRLVLAGTLSSSCGIYGPAFELAVAAPREPGSEEYLDSEKYELRAWDLDAPGSLRPLVTTLNRARRTLRALQWNEGIRFHDTDNPQLLCFSKAVPPGATEAPKGASDEPVLVVANMDPGATQWGHVLLDLRALGVRDEAEAFTVEDVLTGHVFTWQGRRNFVMLDPGQQPAHVLRVRASGVPEAP